MRDEVSAITVSDIKKTLHRLKEAFPRRFKLEEKVWYVKVLGSWVAIPTDVEMKEEMLEGIGLAVRWEMSDMANVEVGLALVKITTQGVGK